MFKIRQSASYLIIALKICNYYKENMINIYAI